MTQAVPRVIALLDDLFFQMKIAETAKHIGVELKVATNTDAHTITFWSRKDRGWGIVFYDKYGPAPGNASLQSPSGKIVGNGTCAMAPSAPAAAPAPAAPPTVEAAKPDGGAAPGSLSAYLGM